MSTFYVMPSRLLLGQVFGEFLASLFPGLSWNRFEWEDLGEALGTAARIQPEVYVLFREDLANEDDLPGSLERDFGAELGDQIIEVSVGEGGPNVRHWQIGRRVAA